jgi:hypothetical protein
MSEEKKVYCYCGGPFGLTRHYVGFRHHLCSEKCKQQFLEARARGLRRVQAVVRARVARPP